MSNIFKDNKYKSILAFCCALGWSLAYPLIKVGYREFAIDSADLGGKILFAGLRFFCAGLLLMIYCAQKKISLSLKKKTDLSWLLLFSLINITLHYMFSYIGLSYNASARSTILDSMGGFFLIIMSIIFFADDKMSSNKLIGCLLGVAGIISINIEPGVNFFSNITFRGDGMILLNTMCAAFGGVITRIISKKMNMMNATGMSMVIGGALLLATGLIIGQENPWHWSIKGIAVLIILILISAVCFAIYNQLLSYHPISKIAIYNALIPVLGVFFAALLLGEKIKWQYYLAVVLVALGVYTVNSESR